MSGPERPPVAVTVTDLRISFGALVALFVKAALAAIPALLILAALFGALYGVAFALLVR